jgi:hypothetical protein
MKKTRSYVVAIAATLVLLLLHDQCAAQIPVIRAQAPLVDVRDGTAFRKEQWRISPGLRPDVYTTHAKHEKVTFITDLDSISCVVDPDRPFEFVILYQDKDSAFTEIRYEPTFLEKLKGGGPYGHEPASRRIPFVYDSADAPAMRSLRARFPLDSIAGAGSEETRVINVLHWVHTTFPHDGAKDAPASTGTQDLMEKCIVGHDPLNCGSLATILKDCYAALGFRSRRLVCLPIDSTDMDCHSIDVVFLPSLGRWVWMDPTNDAYVMDEHGLLIGPGEVRERLIDGRPVRLNEDANWNHRSKVTSDEYLHKYMTKNLFALLYYYRTAHAEGAVLLTPSGYEGAIPRTRAVAPICTHDPEVFWGR